MDCRNEIPPLQKGKVLNENDIPAFGLSLQGSSHVAKDIPCQDYCDLRYLKKEELFLSAIADGVGSCALSHWGAYTAVSAALDAAQKGLERFSVGKKLILDTSTNKTMKDIMFGAFCAAQNAVEEFADQAGEMVFNFQSTLTLAVYDGENLFFGHVGDGGIVVQTADGNVEMLTTRLKGEEASSVFPLQSGEKMWRFGRNAKPISGFVMATDGVLDAFVASRPDYFGINYNNGVYYAFMEDAMDTLADDSPESVQNALDSYKAYMLSEKYRETVTDDLTMVAVVSRAAMKSAVHPKFSIKIWNAVQEASNEAKRQLLHGKPISRSSIRKKTEILGVPTENSSLHTESAELVKQDPVPEAPAASKPKQKPYGFLVLLLSMVISLILGMFLWHVIQLPKDRAREAACEQYMQAYEELERKYTDLEVQLAEAADALDAADTAYETLENEKNKLQQKLESLQKELDSLKTVIAETTEISKQQKTDK